jgi:ribosomal RNA-processing protein 12
MDYANWHNLNTGAAKPRRKPGQDASRFKTEGSSGKMIIADGDSSDDEAAPTPRSRARNAGVGAGTGANGEMDVAGTAYIESMVSTDGFTRGPGGRVKFHKDTKKRRRAEADFDDGMGMDVDEPAKTAPPPMHKKMKGKEKKLGHEFKAKVSKQLISKLFWRKNG